MLDKNEKGDVFGGTSLSCSWAFLMRNISGVSAAKAGGFPLDMS